jgi:hypothetical protein
MFTILLLCLMALSVLGLDIKPTPRSIVNYTLCMQNQQSDCGPSWIEDTDRPENVGNTGTYYPIAYHGGELLNGTTTVHTIFYGTQFTGQYKSIISDYYNALSSSTWWNTELGYVRNSVIHQGLNITDRYGSGPSLSADFSGILHRAIVTNHLGSGATNEVYAIFTDKTVSVTGFCSSFCGFHDQATVSGIGNPVNYLFVGSALRCPMGCNPGLTNKNSPNSNAEIDSLVNILSHELAEIVSDPAGTAWFDNESQPEENADKCAWQFGTILINGKRVYNEVVGSRHFLIQMLWNVSTTPQQRCVN